MLLTYLVFVVGFTGALALLLVGHSSRNLSKIWSFHGAGHVRSFLRMPLAQRRQLTLESNPCGAEALYRCLAVFPFFKTEPENLEEIIVLPKGLREHRVTRPLEKNSALSSFETNHPRLSSKTEDPGKNKATRPDSRSVRQATSCNRFSGAFTYIHRVQQRSSSFAADLRWSEASHWCFTWNNFLSSNVMNSCYKCPRQARYPLKWMNSCTPGRYLVSIFWPQVERQRRIIHLQRKTPGRVTPFHQVEGVEGLSWELTSHAAIETALHPNSQKTS